MKFSHTLRCLCVALPILLGWLSPIAARAQEPASNRVELQYPNNPVSDILEVYERLTGKTLVRDTQIFKGPNISLMAPEPVAPEEAIHLIEAALLLNGYLLLPGQDAGTLKVILSDPKAGRTPLREGLPLFTREEDLPSGEKLVGYFMRLQHLTPDDALAIFESHYQASGYGRITRIYTPPGLLITDSVSVIRQFIRLQSLLDVAEAGELPPVKTELVELRYADAVRVAEMIQALVDNRRAEPPPPPRPTPAAAGGAGAKPRPSPTPRQPRQVLTKERLLAIDAQLLPDERSNRILVVTSPDNFPYIRGLIEELDQPIELRPPWRRPLKYIAAEDVLPILSDVLSDTASEMSRPEVTQRSLEQLGQQLNQSIAQRVAAAQRSAPIRSGQGRTTGLNSDAERPDQLVEPVEDNTPVSVLVGKTRVIADRQANEILVIGLQQNCDKVASILDVLDRRPPQVYLATVIGQLTHESGTELGASYLLKNARIGSDSSASGALLNTLRLGDAIGNLTSGSITGAVRPLEGLTLFGSFGEELTVIIRALEETNRFKVLSRPAVYAANNRKAVITSGQRIPVPVDTITRLDRDEFRTNIEFRDVVLKLEVIPLINSEREVTLRIAQVNDNVIGQQEIAQNQVPIISTEELNTTVTIPNRHTVVLGGLISEQQEKRDSGVPVLSRIPVLGHAFKTSENRKTRRELIVFIQPVVVDSDEELRNASLQEDLRTEIGSEAAKRMPQQLPPVTTPTPRPPAPPSTPASRNPRFR